MQGNNYKVTRYLTGCERGYIEETAHNEVQSKQRGCVFKRPVTGTPTGRMSCVKPAGDVRGYTGGRLIVSKINAGSCSPQHTAPQDFCRCGISEQTTCKARHIAQNHSWRSPCNKRPSIQHQKCQNIHHQMPKTVRCTDSGWSLSVMCNHYQLSQSLRNPHRDELTLLCCKFHKCIYGRMPTHKWLTVYKGNARNPITSC